MIKNHQLVKELLDSGKGLRITFEKSDGSTRQMFCTTATTLIPEEKAPKGTGTFSSDETQRVFDLDKQEWRSFRWSSLKSYIME